MIDVEMACRQSRAAWMFRTLRVLICGFLVGMGALLAAVSPRAWPGAVVVFALAAGIWLLFRWRLRAYVKTCRAVCAMLEDVARADLDRPAELVARAGDDGVGTLASNPRFARYIARRSVRFAVGGTWKGAPVEYGTAVTAGRDFDFRLSHVRVGGRAAAGAFRVMSRGVATSMARWHHHEREIATGDADFDRDWVVDADEPIARRVLDGSMRAELGALHRQLGGMQVASIEATPAGLIVRWPGPLEAGWAARLRDLALAIDTRMRG